MPKIRLLLGQCSHIHQPLYLFQYKMSTQNLEPICTVLYIPDTQSSSLNNPHLSAQSWLFKIIL